MKPRDVQLKSGKRLTIREASESDAAAILEYLEVVSGETDFLSFGPGEFELTLPQEEEYLCACRSAANQLYVVGTIDEMIVATTNFAGGPRPRNAHCGEFGMSVRRDFWGDGVGAAMLDALLDWATDNPAVTKVNLRVRADNARAIGLYVSRGFESEGVVRRDFRVAGEYFDHQLMGRDV